MEPPEILVSAFGGSTHRLACGESGIEAEHVSGLDILARKRLGCVEDLVAGGIDQRVSHVLWQVPVPDSSFNDFVAGHLGRDVDFGFPGLVGGFEDDLEIARGIIRWLLLEIDDSEKAGLVEFSSHRLGRRGAVGVRARARPESKQSPRQ